MATYYVATTGNNGDTGGVGDPFLTIQYAHDQASPGDTIQVAAGTYNEQVTITTDRLTIQGATGGAKPVIWYAEYNSATNPTGYSAIVKITRECVFDNFEVRGDTGSIADADYLYHQTAIEIGGNSSAWNYGHVTVKNCECHHIGGEGIKSHYQDGILVQDNVVHDSVMRNYNAKLTSGQLPDPNWDGGTSFTRGANYVIRGNHVYDVWGEGIPLDFGVVNAEIVDNKVGRTWSGKIYIGEAQHAKIHRNLVWDPIDLAGFAAGPHDGLGLTDESYTPNQMDIDDVQFYNNIAVDCASGIWLDHGVDEPNTKNVHFYNNTIVTLRAGHAGFRMYGTSFMNVAITNNIFYVASGGAIAATGYISTNVFFDRNIWNVAPNPLAGGTNDQYIDPLLVAPTTVISGSLLTDIDATDYKISTGSPAIDYGDSQVSVDYFGSSRAGIVDVGAHEYDGTAPPPDIDTAVDWGAAGADGLHYNTVVQTPEQYGRYFNGINAFVDLNPTAATFDPDNGAIILRAIPDEGGFNDGKAHHLYEAYAWNDSTVKNSLFLIKQSEVNGRIDFVVMVEGDNASDAVTIPFLTSQKMRSVAWRTLAMTWDSGGNIVAYVDGTAVGSVAFPGTWAASGFSFIRAGSGGGINYYKGQLAHLITVYGETPSATAIANISEYLENNITNTAALDAQITVGAYHWHNIRDAVGETEPEPFICDFVADDVTPEVPQTVTFDLTGSVLPAGEDVDYVELLPGVGLLTDVVTEDGPTMPTSIAYEYTAVGTYDVIVTIFLTNGESQRLIKREYIEASPPWVTFTCDFVADETEFTVDQLVTFDLTSSVVPGGFTVDYVKLIPGFGTLQDTVTTAGPSMPTDIAYTYTTPGLHDVRIEIHLVESDLFARETKTDYIQANAPAIGDPTWTDEVVAIQALLQQIEDNLALIEAAV